LNPIFNQPSAKKETLQHAGKLLWLFECRSMPASSGHVMFGRRDAVARDAILYRVAKEVRPLIAIVLEVAHSRPSNW
jgi:hypothetical protein